MISMDVLSVRVCLLGAAVVFSTSVTGACYIEEDRCQRLCLGGDCPETCGRGGDSESPSGAETSAGGSAATSSVGVIDTDSDGLSDAFESLCNTHAELVDTDFDGIPDAWEDPGGDGFVNLEEYRARTHPGDSYDHPTPAAAANPPPPAG